MAPKKGQKTTESSSSDEESEQINFKFDDGDSDDQASANQAYNNDSDDDSDDGDGESDDYDEEDDDDEPSTSNRSRKDVLIPEENPISRIKNKIRRREVYEKYLLEKKKKKQEDRAQKKKLAEELGDDAPPKQIPRTIENTREVDETMVPEDDDEVMQDEALDEFASYFNKEREPKLIITTSDNYHEKTIKFCKELSATIPHCEYKTRNKMSIKKMCVAASEKGYTDLLIVNEDRKKPNGLLVIHLPNGPTANFKLSSVRYLKEIKNRVAASEHRPEVILNNFNTRLGHSIGRMLASLYHYDPQFTGRRVITFHNQRDFIFFRHHRYQFKDGKRVALRECGPRFTLKLRWLQRGTFDSKTGEYIWLLKRHEMETSRRRFFL